MTISCQKTSVHTQRTGVSDRNFPMDNKADTNPWLRVLDALEHEEETELTTDELGEDVASRGMDPARLVGTVGKSVSSFLQQQSWRERAQAKQQRFLGTVFDRARSWVDRPPEEIERGVLAARSGAWGPQVQAAFREKASLSLEDKARILDDLENLRALDDSEGDEQEG